jgi:outer membrane lipoprotein-sorting protein
MSSSEQSTTPGPGVGRRAFIGAAIGLVAAGRVWAATPVAVPLTAADQAELQRIEAYLNGIKTLQAKFQQTAADGAVTSGSVWLSRPGKMRLDYDPPAKLQLVANDGLVAVNDLSVKHVQYIPIDETAAWFLLRDKITLTGDVTVTRFEHGPKTIRVTATQTKDASTGSLTVLLSEDPLTLRQWTVLDAQGKTVTVALTEAQDGVQLAASLFELPSNVNTAPRSR